MKRGYKKIRGVSGDLDELLKKAFYQPETFYVTTTEPTLDDMLVGEFKTYYDGSDYWLYQKVSKTVMAKMQWTIVS